VIRRLVASGIFSDRMNVQALQKTRDSSEIDMAVPTLQVGKKLTYIVESIMCCPGETSPV
jgi:hypothetical protein